MLRAFDGVAADVRYAIRTLARQPVFMMAAVLSLALGIGANSAIFSFADALLLRPLAIARPAEVLDISNSTPAKPTEGLSWPDYRDFRATTRAFSGLVAYRSSPMAVSTSTAAPPQMLLTAMISDNLGSVLGLHPLLGRAFVGEHERTAILGYRFWRNAYGGDPSAVGRTVRVGGVELTIVGVFPESFHGLDRFFDACVFVPLSTWGTLTGEGRQVLEGRARHELIVKGRLNPGVTRQAAQAEASAIAANLETAWPKTNHLRRIHVRTEVGAQIKQDPPRFAAVTMLLVLATMVLIIACVNVANLLLARARARRREIATRLAIGAGGFRLLRQLLIEGLVVALLGGVAGVGIAYGGIAFLSTIQVPSDIPFVLGLRLDERVLAFTLFSALVSSVLFGLVPGLQAIRVDLVPALKAGGEASSARRRTPGRNVLVVGQIALAMVLLIMAGVLLEGFREMVTADPGFRRDHLIAMEFDPSVLRYTPDQARRFYRELVERIRSMPEVVSVAKAQALPMANGQSSLAVSPEGYRFPKGQENAEVLGAAVDENYFATMRVPIVEGRPFRAHDGSGSRQVAIVNQQFANKFWPGQNPLGKRLWVDRADGPGAVVLGVTKTGRYLFPWEAPTPYVWFPYDQRPTARMKVVVESRGDPGSLAAPLRNAVHAIDPEQPIYSLQTVAEAVNWSLDAWLVLVRMIAAMGFLGLTLAMVGLYGLIAYAVSRRTAEIGIRMAIGASRPAVLRMVLRQGLLLAGTGTVIGGTLAFLLVPALISELAGAGAMSPAIFIGIPLALFSASATACWLPARRAAMLDPLVALRYE